LMSVIMMSAIMMSVILMSVIMLSVIMMSVIMMSVTKVSVIILNVVAPFRLCLNKHYLGCLQKIARVQQTQPLIKKQKVQVLSPP
jgi:hypothetical protein